MPTLIVRSRAAVRRRAGLRFTREPDVYEVTKEQEEAIRADSGLVVIEDAPKAPEPKPEPEIDVVAEPPKRQEPGPSQPRPKAGPGPSQEHKQAPKGTGKH